MDIRTTLPCPTKIVARNELKYLISYSEYIYLRTLLGSMMQKDSYGDETGQYYIRSLYFDDATEQDFFTKEAGVANRKKVRLRIYNFDSDNVKFEIKNKMNQQSVKETLIISREDAIAISQGNSDCLQNYSGKMAEKLYGMFKTDHLRPVTLIDYEREAYVLNGLDIRINFDKQIRSSSASMNLYDQDVQMMPLLYDMMVLEVKFSHILPDFIRDILSSSVIRKTSFSKYMLARQSNW